MPDRELQMRERAMPDEPKISLVVCTYNRSDLVDGVLRTLCDQSLPESAYEVLVVDNNSKDDTRAVADAYVQGHGNVRYLFEPEQGLSHARNRGLREAVGEYIGYLDDDVEVPASYVETLQSVVSEVRPAVVGGPGFALYKSRKPYWYKDSYAAYELTDSPRELADKEFLFGFNMVFRRDLLEQVGGFDPELGMRGDDIGYGEEIAPQILIRDRFPKEVIYYDPQLYVNHLVRPEKMTVRWMMESRYRLGEYGHSVFRGGREPASVSRQEVWRKTLRCVWVMLKDGTIGALRRDRQLYPYYMNYLCEHTFEHLPRLGRLHRKYKLAKALDRPAAP